MGSIPTNSTEKEQQQRQQKNNLTNNCTKIAALFLELVLDKAQFCATMGKDILANQNNARWKATLTREKTGLAPASAASKAQHSFCKGKIAGSIPVTGSQAREECKPEVNINNL